jgi:AraC-like DNA-binding protein
MESIPLHRVAVVRPFAQLLADIGAPVERAFQQAGLPYSALENVNNYVPSHRFWAFLVNMAHNEGIEDLGFRVGQRFGADSADPHLTELLHRSPTLYQGLLQASELTNKTISHCRLGLIQPPGSGYTYFFHRPSCDADNPAIEQIGWFGITTLIGMARVFTGPEWQPTEIGLMTRHTPCHSIREQFADTRIRLSRQFSYIALENALLSQPPLIHEATTSASSPITYKPIATDFVGSLKQVLHAYVGESDLNIEFAAGLCDTSKRSLQRKLTETGTRYSEVLDQARFDVANQMLQEPGMKVTDVASRLGYSNATHFSRAFRRFTGFTPRMYRQTYGH